MPPRRRVPNQDRRRLRTMLDLSPIGAARKRLAGRRSPHFGRPKRETKDGPSQRLGPPSVSQPKVARATDQSPKANTFPSWVATYSIPFTTTGSGHTTLPEFPTDALHSMAP